MHTTLLGRRLVSRAAALGLIATLGLGGVGAAAPPAAAGLQPPHAATVGLAADERVPADERPAADERRAGAAKHGPVATVATGKPKRDYVKLVDPFVETDRARYFFFQSASNPFGFVKLRPDTGPPDGGATGYRTTENHVKGFSHIHEWQFSGIQVMPTSGQSVPKLQGEPGWQSHVDHDETEVAEPGYHKLELDRYAITAELTATDRVGMHRYTYHRAGPSEIIVNLGGTLGEAIMEDASITRVSDTEVEGYVDQRGGSYADFDTRLYFTLSFDRPFDSLHGWADGRLARGGAPIEQLTGENLGLYVRYDQLPAGAVVQMKVALSLTGVDGARKNLAAEAPGWSFDAVKNASQRRWNAMLGRIDVRGGTKQQQVKFYTDLFHVLCGRGVVSDVDGKYLDDTWNANRVRQIPLDKHGRPTFAMYTYDALWLTQWNVNSILGLAYPEIYASFVKSQLRMYEDGGLLPRGPVAGNDSLIMTGSPVTSFIVGAWNKGIRDFDPDLAYEAMMDAHAVGGLFDKGALEYSSWTGAGGIRDYLDKGYIPYRSGAGLNGGAGMTLEYAFQDWTLAQFARQFDRKGINVAQLAQVEASSQRDGSAHAAARAVDGRPMRSAVGPGDGVEWASDGERRPSLTLRWESPRTVRQVVLSDRASGDSDVNAGVLRFSDGSSVAVTGIPTDGREKVVSFRPRRVSWVRFEVTAGTGTDVGLNEIEVWDTTDVARYLEERSRNWRNVFDTSTGFVRPRLADGSWLADFDPLNPADFVEANSWQATWFTSHDVMGLANLMGGETAYADKLNYAFERAAPANFIGAYGQGYVSYGNQPGLQVGHLFNYVGKPWLTQYWVRQVKEKTYGSTSTTDGYGHHDEDQGQMGAMSALMAMGLFEVTGGGLARPVYDITSPVFDEITITLNRDYYPGTTFRIVTHDNSATNTYIQRARLDGKPLHNAWFHHDQLADGGTLELWMGPRPNTAWGVDTLPFSESASEGREPVRATAITIAGPDRIEEPYGTARYEAHFTPEDTTWQRAFWSVTELDGSPTDKAVIDHDGVLRVNRRDGKVLVTAVNSDSGPPVRATLTVTLDLDVDLLRGNAARWPGVVASASSEYSSGYAASKVHDGIVNAKDAGDWASRGEREPWVQLDWEQPVRADRMVLYDRPGDDDSHGGTLSFSDGSTVEVTGLPRNGSPLTVRFPMRTFDWVRFQIRGGTGLNPGMSEIEVHAVPTVPRAPVDVAVERGDGEATVSWRPPAFDGGAPLTGYVVTPYREGVAQAPVTVDETTTEVVVPGLDQAAAYTFTVAARNLLGTGPAAGEPVLATDIEVNGPDRVVEPYGSVRYEAVFEPADTTLKEATWTVTEPDGTPTTKATIDANGVLTVNHRDGTVHVTATAADGGGARASIPVTIALDPALLRGNAARWPGVTATASSTFDDSYRPARVHDGFGPGSGEWASRGEQDPWLQLTWPAPVRADAVTLYDRPGVDDVNGGTLSFSDGSTVTVTGVPPGGAAKTVTFAPKTFTWVRFQVEGGDGPNVGLAEVEVAAFPEPPGAPVEVSAYAGAGQATVYWSLPEFDGGAPVTGFVVTPYADGTPLEPLRVDEDATSVVVPGLQAGRTYTFTVAARNLLGTGPPSEPTGPVVPD